MASAEDFDQTKYTEASWATLAALPACADSYSSTSVEAPMLMSILLNPTKYQAGEFDEMLMLCTTFARMYFALPM